MNFWFKGHSNGVVWEIDLPKIRLPLKSLPYYILDETRP